MRKGFVSFKLCGVFLICIAVLMAVTCKQDTSEGFYKLAENTNLAKSERDKKAHQKSYALRFPVR